MENLKYNSLEKYNFWSHNNNGHDFFFFYKNFQKKQNYINNEKILKNTKNFWKKTCLRYRIF